ncbi:ABC transporter permease [Sphingobium boeckii]|uniref:ABC-2 type transport system permease protein n=1 Tax=Sphingobium boeckii TaxID=1082345 RepID=A0A7W9AEW1_9SPHN|nr:ABC transporter permease [Sphingobium boeckii]MBB5684174.1 ABC-2 type transport system permease protein [Sphingobium boeckii]
MKRLVRQTLVIARRDFIATVFTPTFLLFLLAPFFMIGFATIGGLGARQMVTSTKGNVSILFIANAADGAKIAAVDGQLRKSFSMAERPADLMIIKPDGRGEAQARALFAQGKHDVYAVAFGPLERLTILRSGGSDRSAAYLAELAEQVLRDGKAGLATGQRLTDSRVIPIERETPTQGGRQGIGFAAVFIIFFLTLLLAGQAVGMLAEEKGNKVIEILAAAVPLESVFLGKLIGMFGVALLFVAFWGLLATQGLNYFPTNGLSLATLQPAIGLPLFFVFGAAYFTMAYLLLGAVFLGVGAQASTVREIQMLSLPITIFQVAMFGLSSSAASQPGTDMALFAEIFPFSSPFSMAARGATDPRIWPHLLALGWQLTWVALTIFVAARMFRRGVLKSGSGGLKRLFGRQKSVPAAGLEPRS